MADQGMLIGRGIGSFLRGFVDERDKAASEAAERERMTKLAITGLLDMTDLNTKTGQIQASLYLSGLAGQVYPEPSLLARGAQKLTGGKVGKQQSQRPGAIDPREALSQGALRIREAAEKGMLTSTPSSSLVVPGGEGGGPSISNLEEIPGVGKPPVLPMPPSPRAQIEVPGIQGILRPVPTPTSQMDIELAKERARLMERRETEAGVERRHQDTLQTQRDIEASRESGREASRADYIKLHYDQLQERMNENKLRLADRAIDRSFREELMRQNLDIRREQLELSRERLKMSEKKATGQLTPQMMSGLNVLHVSLFGDTTTKQHGLADTLNIFDSSLSRGKLALMPTLLNPPENPSSVGNLMRTAQSGILRPEEREFVRQYARAVSAINALRSVTGLPRATQQLMVRYMNELPNPSVDKSKAEAMERLALVEREIQAALRGGALEGAGETTPPAVPQTQPAIGALPTLGGNAPPGATLIAPGSDGKNHYTDASGRDLGVAP